jgi:hypothetical protein
MRNLLPLLSMFSDFSSANDTKLINDLEEQNIGIAKEYHSDAKLLPRKQKKKLKIRLRREYSTNASLIKWLKEVAN